VSRKKLASEPPKKHTSMSKLEQIGNKAVLTDDQGNKQKFKDYYTAIIHINQNKIKVSAPGLPVFYLNLIDKENV